MRTLLTRVRVPVRRLRAERLVLLTLLSFAATVTVTRLFLYLTGYPQLGGGRLHVAHVLWGGLVLFGAALLPLILANRWAFTVGALLTGVGMGLFIDEVGKFITQNNDYFFAPAAPIIYAVFLLSVLVYLQVRRPQPRQARAELYAALEGFQDVLDHDLEPDEQEALLARLRHAERLAESPDSRRLAEALLGFLGPGVHLAPERTGVFEQLRRRWQRFETSWLKRRRLRTALMLALAALGVLSVAQLAQLLLAARSPAGLGRLVADLVSLGRVNSSAGLAWFSARVALEAAVGGILLVAAALLAFGQERPGVEIGFLGLTLSLAAVNLLVFYFEQFSTIALASAQLVALLGLLHYRRRYLGAMGESLRRTAEIKDR